MDFSVTPVGNQINEVFAQEGHTNITPKWSLCTCV